MSKRMRQTESERAMQRDRARWTMRERLNERQRDSARWIMRRRERER